ncbi:MAG: hypothetical protein ACT4PX_12390, partial [Actinomycetota bacterium]
MAMVEGEGGVGKTRLIEELAAGLAVEGRLVLIGHCHRVHEPFPLRTSGGSRARPRRRARGPGAHAAGRRPAARAAQVGRPAASRPGAPGRPQHGTPPARRCPGVDRPGSRLPTAIPSARRGRPRSPTAAPVRRSPERGAS